MFVKCDHFMGKWYQIWGLVTVLVFVFLFCYFYCSCTENYKFRILPYFWCPGEVEKQYCSRITHVLCETQRHGVVMQALRDYKRCVTLYWLSDIMKRKQVLPPWTALHLPTMYLDTTPASKHLISLTGFGPHERNRIKHMIKYIGATVRQFPISP